MTIEKVTFKSFGVDLVGNLYLPDGFDANKQYKAIVGDQPMQSLFSLCEHYADKIVQPTLVVYGQDAPTAICSTAFIEKLTNNPEVLAVGGFSHVDFYHKPEAVKVSTDAVAEFFNK